MSGERSDKPRYNTPRVTPLGGLNTGLGGCISGSTANGNCNSGWAPSNHCGNGSQPPRGIGNNPAGADQGPFGITPPDWLPDWLDPSE